MHYDLKFMYITKLVPHAFGLFVIIIWLCHKSEMMQTSTSKINLDFYHVFE